MAMQYWFQYVYSDLLKRGAHAEAQHWRTLWPMPAWFYGDDTLGYFPEYAYRYVVGKEWADRVPWDKPTALNDFLSTILGLRLKMSDCAVFLPEFEKDPLLTVVNQHGTIVRPGPKFLQRRFVHIMASEDFLKIDPTLYEHSVAAYRTSHDYWTRASTTVNGSTWASYIMKLRGLAIDTAGINASAFAFLKHMHDEVCKQHPESIEVLENFDLKNDYEMIEFRRRVADSGLPYELMRDFPDYTHLQFHYWPRKSHCRSLVTHIRESGLYPHLYW